MPSREALVICARSIAHSYKGVQPDSSFPSWETLKAIYDQAMAIPPDWAIHNGANLTALKQGRWLRKDGVPGGTTDKELGISWCGIFQTYVLQCCGIPVKWQTYAGITPREPYLEKLSGFGNWADIRRGDICIRDDNQHHFLVYARSGDQLSSYDGNLDGQRIGEPLFTTPVRKVHTILRPRF